MEKGPSTFAEYWTSEYNEVEHYKHAKEFGFDKITDYSNAAMKFGKSKNDSLLIFRRSDDSICKYSGDTKEFIVISKEGEIITYYKSSIRYFIHEWNKTGVEKLKGDWQ